MSKFLLSITVLHFIKNKGLLQDVYLPVDHATDDMAFSKAAIKELIPNYTGCGRLRGNFPGRIA
jgi:hypothetical protein